MPTKPLRAAIVGAGYFARFQHGPWHRLRIHRMSPLQLTALALALLATTGCTTHRAAPSAATAATSLNIIEWPDRQYPTPGGLKKDSDFAPKDFGVYADSRIYGHPDVPPAEQSTLTVTSQAETLGPVEVFHSKVTLTKDGRSGSLALRNQRATFTIAYEADQHTATRGNIAFLTSLNTLSSQEESLITHLTRSGWNVLAVTSSTDLLTISELEATDPGRLVLTRLSTPETLARMIDDHIAERAYTTRATLDFLRANNTSWDQQTLVVLGASLGGLAVPATVAHLAPGVDAAVLVAAGARVPNIFTETSLGLFVPTAISPGPGPEIDRLRPLTPAEASELADAATALSQLDPEKTAPALHGIPTLLLHARSDQIVPARYGRRLAELLPDAERWSYPFGHTTLFLSLPFSNARIARWIDRNTAVPSRSSVVY